MEKSIKLYDDFLPATLMHGIWITATKENYKKENQDLVSDYGITNTPRPKWRANLNVGNSIIDEFVDNVLKVSTYKKVAAVYYNYSTFSDVDLIHTDTAVSVESETALYYCNLNWSREFGGETFFYDYEQKELNQVIEYKPNRLIIFDGRIPHCARPPTIAATQGRYTLAVKLMKE